MLPYATEQQVLKIVEQKLRESGGGDTPSKEEIIAIVNKAIEDGEINVSAFDEVEVKLYFSDFDTSANLPRLINNEKKEILSNIASKVKDNKLVIGSYKTPQYAGSQEGSTYIDEANGVVSNENNTWDSKFFIVFGVYRVVSDDVGYTATCSFAYSNGGYMIMEISDAQALFTVMATDPTKYISLKFRVEK